jgi:hypothetical protein
LVPETLRPFSHQKPHSKGQEEATQAPPAPPSLTAPALERNENGKCSLSSIVKALNKMKDNCGDDLRFRVDGDGHLVVEKVTVVSYS